MSRPTDASFFVQTAYTLRAVWADLWQRKFGTLLTILVIAVSLTIPTVSYLMWKNLHLATTQFYPESELTIYLHKNLSEEDANLVVEKIRQQDGVQEVRLDNDWMEKLTALSWLIAHVAIFCTVLMTIAVFLVIGNSIRSDVYSSRSSIDVMKLLGATDQFILRPYLYTGMIYAVLGGLVAAIFSSFIISYFTSAVKYVTDIFAVQFSLNGLGVGEFVFLLVCCLIMGYVGAWIVAKRHITLLDNHH